MQIRFYILLVAITTCFVTISHAQPKNYDIKNGFAIGGGITQFDLITDNFETKAGSGWMIQASATADLPHKWYNISYNIQLAQNQLGIMGRETAQSTNATEINYDLFTAQLGLIAHVKLAGNFLTLDLGPQLQYNGNLELASSNQENLFLNGFDALLASDIEEVSKFNVNGMAGVTAGVGPIKVKAQYIYGVLNTLNKLNDQTLNVPDSTDFEGNMSMWAFTAQFTF